MAVFTFVCRSDGGSSWSAKQHPASEDGCTLEGSADSSFDLQRLLTKLSLSSGASGSVSSSFSYVTPTSAVFQVIIGGGGGGGFVSSGAVASGGGGGAAAAPVVEEKEEVKEKEEESDDDMGFSLFD